MLGCQLSAAPAVLPGDPLQQFRLPLLDELEETRAPIALPIRALGFGDSQSQNTILVSKALQHEFHIGKPQLHLPNPFQGCVAQPVMHAPAGLAAPAR